MKFVTTSVDGVWIVEEERHADERGWFARTWCTSELSEQGLVAELSQCSASYNHRRGTLRGMHFQAAPYGETKLVRCVRGAIYDVVLDMREDSTSYGQWVGVELTAENGRAVYIPEGCAHGFQTTEEGTEVLYMMAGTYCPEAARGIRWDDPRFGIEWPLPEIAFMSERDASYPDYRSAGD